MKVVNFFAHVFTIFAFLTLGSLLVIVSLHLLSADDAVLNIRELYSYPWNSAKTGFLGLVFILVGLIFSKSLLKTGRQTDAVIVPSESGPIAVQLSAVEDLIRKTAKKFQQVKDLRIKILVSGKDLEIRLRFVLWAGSRVPDLVAEIQESIRCKILKLLGAETKVDIHCDVIKIEDHTNGSGPRSDIESENTVLSKQ